MTALRLLQARDAVLTALAYLVIASFALVATLACGGLVVLTLLGTLQWGTP